MKFTLSLTHDCNLACSYCYAGRKFKKDMTIATAQKIVNFAMRVTPKDKPVDFSFFGGESLLKFDLMKEIVEYIRNKEMQTKKNVTISITSNGTILTESILDFLKEQSIHFCISIDGPENVHNKKRQFKNGKGSFDVVKKNLILALTQLRSVQVNAVYGPDTIDDLPETVSFFSGLGVPSIHLNLDISGRWKTTSYNNILKKYRQIGDQYVRSYKEGKELAINLIDNKIILLLKGGYKGEDKCSMGETEWGFSPSGKIYPCERFIGEDNNPLFCLGDITTGMDQPSVCSLLKHRGNRSEKCKSCNLIDYCMNWCGCTNHFMTGCADLVGPVLCKSEKAAIKVAKEVLVSLKENDFFIDHFFHYIQKDI